MLIKKILRDHVFVVIIGILTGVFYIIAFVDLFKYYNNMVFPQEKFFENTIKN